MPETFLWYDLETFGKDPRTSRIAQFAGIRTDQDLNPVGPALSFFCQAATDFLPEPEACMVTGISPQYSQQHGLPEADFINQIQQQLSQAQTCALGYNSIRFDDEFIRFGLYRNFFDAYEREYSAGNSRWDLLDVLRMVYALQPELLQWPLREEGLVSFKLEHLAKANACFEGTAHEALSDVRSLINLARKIKQGAPHLWDYALSLRDKSVLANKLLVHKNQRILHISGQFPTTQGCTGLMLSLMAHPLIKTRTIAVELRPEALQLIHQSADEIERNIFTKSSQRAEGERRIGLKEIHHNRCPIVLEPSDVKTLDIAIDLSHLKIDRKQAQEIHAELSLSAESIRHKLHTIYSKVRHFDDSDPDAALYSGFIDKSDKNKFNTARASKGQADLVFHDERLSELYFRYKARNWPESLSDAEQLLWQQQRANRLPPEHLNNYLTQCEHLLAANPEQQGILNALKDWAIKIAQ